MRGGTDAHEHDYDHEYDYGLPGIVIREHVLPRSPALRARNRTRSRARARLFIRSLWLLSALLITTAHVGSPNVWYDGPAGPYSIRVLVRPPKVVPGLADIVVRVHGGAERVTVAPARWDTGDEGAPAPDIATRVDGESFSARLWLMARGPYRIVVTIEGERGRGTTIVPVMATAEQRLAMPGALGIVLLAASVFLFFGLISLVGAAVRESVLAPGHEPSDVRRQGARVAMMIAAPVAVLLLFGGWRWWNAVDNAHRSGLDRPWTANASVTRSADGSRVLTLQITDSIWTNRHAPEIARRFAWHTLIPDHGKLMHMFLIREGDLAGFAHVHPSTSDSTRFAVSLPPLPAGTYRVFADIVLESGATHTLVTRAVLGDSVTASGAAATTLDADDAAWSGAALGSLTGSSTELPGGSIMRWSLPARIVADQEVDLTVGITDALGTLVPLETYMGMPGHAMVQHEDGSVFVHLHPMGTISVAAQQALRTAGGTAIPASHVMPVDSRITFPYAFPKPGRYRLWVQIQQSGRVLTGVHDLTVISGT